MKTNLLRKFKWYIVGIILIVIMLSVGLSFCTWDDLSIQALNANANIGKYEWSTIIKDKDGNELITEPKIGDIVTFGRYYQDLPIENGDDIILPEKTALRWIVVDIDSNNRVTLLAENVLAFGNFWSNAYYGAEGKIIYETPVGTYYQNYEKSTIRAWLNSNPTSRNDGGPQFNESGTFAGFLNEAFNTDEQNYIVAQNITNIRGGSIDSDKKQDYAEIIGDKVWLPSYTQVFGDDAPKFAENDCNDGLQSPIKNSQFGYFSKNNTKTAKTTAFASSSASNYTWKGILANSIYNWQSTIEGSIAWWWLRSPNPDHHGTVLLVHKTGLVAIDSSPHSAGGVRPAVCVQL